MLSVVAEMLDPLHKLGKRLICRGQWPITNILTLSGTFVYIVTDKKTVQQKKFWEKWVFSVSNWAFLDVAKTKGFVPS